MEIVPTSDNLKRYWRRGRYQRLSGADTNRKKVKTRRLGGVTDRQQINLIPEMKSKIFSPIKLLAMFHDAYVDTVIGFACKVGRINKVRALGGERIAKSSQVLTVSTTCEQVDSKLVLEIYERFAASRQLSG